MGDEGDKEGSLGDYNNDELGEKYIVLKSKLKKFIVLLWCEQVALVVSQDKTKCKFYKTHHIFKKRALKEAKKMHEKKEDWDIDVAHFVPLVLWGNCKYLYYVGGP